MKNSTFMFNEGRDVMLKHLNETDGKKDEITKVAFLLILSQGISSTMLAVHTVSNVIVKISDRKLKPVILYSHQENVPERTFDVFSRFIRSIVRNRFPIIFNTKDIRNAHEEALKQAL
jgi:hypothetical protein